MVKIATIGKAPLKNRTKEALYKAGLYPNDSAMVVSMIGKENFSQREGVGPKTIEDIEKWLDNMGYSLS